MVIILKLLNLNIFTTTSICHENKCEYCKYLEKVNEFSFDEIIYQITGFNNFYLHKLSNLLFQIHRIYLYMNGNFRFKRIIKFRSFINDEIDKRTFRKDKDDPTFF